MTEEADWTSPMWLRLPPDLRERIDGRLCLREWLQAVILIRAEGGLEPKPGLYEVQDMVMGRLAWLSRHGLVEPEPPPPGIAELIDKARALPDPVVAIEAVWDGGVPFHFGRPDQPDLDSPRWWDTRRADDGLVRSPTF